jgi:hypothetical protein
MARAMNNQLRTGHLNIILFYVSHLVPYIKGVTQAEENIVSGKVYGPKREEVKEATQAV